MLMLSFFRKPDKSPPLREIAVGVVVTETAVSIGLDSDSAATAATYAQFLLRRGCVLTCRDAIRAGEEYARRLGSIESKIEERHGNLGWVPSRHLRGINAADRPQPPAVEVEAV